MLTESLATRALARSLAVSRRAVAICALLGLGLLAACGEGDPGGGHEPAPQEPRVVEKRICAATAGGAGGLGGILSLRAGEMVIDGTVASAAARLALPGTATVPRTAPAPSPPSRASWRCWRASPSRSRRTRSSRAR